MTITELQTLLKQKGFDPGTIDGVLGGNTRAAIRAFQAANGLGVDGIAGPQTQAALLGAAPATPQPMAEIPLDMPWLIEALRLIDTKEVAGPGNNPLIMNWADDLDVGYASDEVAWCGLFVGHCVGSQLPFEGLPQNILGARQWLKFGDEVTPQFGSVLVFWRSSPESWKGHVGFYWGEDHRDYHVLGGNQSNAVNIKKLKKTRLLGARWPKSVTPRNIVRHVDPNGAVNSVTEA